MAVQSYSVQFNGSTQYLSTPRILDSSGDLTIEAWIYITATPSANGAFVLGQYVGAGADRTIFNVDNTLKVGFQAGAVSMGSTTTLVLNRWYHVAVTRIGSGTNNMALYVNGTKEGQMTYTGTFQNTNTTIGYTPNLVNTWLTGYISNLRIVKGTAVYTTNFTIPSSPLNVVTNTALLTCNSTTIVDNSGNNVVITLNGSPVAGTFSPFFTTGIALRNTIVQAYSVALNGTNQYYTAPVTSSLVFGTGDYTIECWIYPTTTTGRMFGSGNALGNYFCFIVEAGKLVTGRIGFAGAEELISTATVPTNTWTHLAGSRQSGTGRIFINGVLDKSAAIGTNYATPAGANYLGSDGGNYTNGYISNLRVIKGQAIYTASFTVPTAPLTAVTNTQLLTFNDSVVRDGSSNNLTMTAVNSPPVSSSITPFGPNYSNRLKLRNTIPAAYSVTFNGTTDYLSLTYSSALNLTGTYTIEGWVKITNTSSLVRYLFQMSATTTANFAIVGIYVLNGIVTVETRPTTGGALSSITGATTLSTNTWYHIAVSNNANSCKLFINGAQDGSGTISTMAFTPNFVAVGRLTNGFTTNQGYHAGSISNFRIVTGTSLYNSNFTPPNTPLGAISGTQLLTCADTTIKDNSTNNYTISTSGTPAVSTDNAFGVLYSNRLKIYSLT